MMRNGALNDPGVPEATDFGDVDVIDVPGRPVPIATPGHTSGHTAFLVPGARVLLTGDALVTGHALARRSARRSSWASSTTTSTPCTPRST